MKKLPTVSIAIPVHNEANTITHVVEALLRQKTTTYHLDRIIVFCDGCTDDSFSLMHAIAIKNTLLSVINQKKQMGKSNAINTLFATIQSDICVLLDADILIKDNSLIEKLVEPFSDESIGITSGNDIPLEQKGLFTKLTVTWYQIWYAIRKNIHGGDSIHNIHGPIYAIRKNLYKHIKIPTNIQVDDQFIYISAKKRGLNLQFVEHAKVYYLIPSSITDYFRQHSRYIHGDQMLNSYFDKTINTYYRVPKQHIFRGIFVTFAKAPIATIGAVTLQIILRLIQPYFKEKQSKGTWQTITTSKNIYQAR